MTIIAAVDADKHAAAILEEALSLARAYGETLHVVHAVPSVEFAEIQRKHVEAGGETLTRGGVARDHIETELDSDLLTDTDVDVEFVGLDGEPAESIIDYAAEINARYIVLGGRGRSPAGKALFGSVAQSVILGAEAPVVVTSV